MVMESGAGGDSDLVEIHRGAGGTAVADLITATLAAEGIPCLIKSDTAIAMMPLPEGPLGYFQVYVRSSDAQRAKEILSEKLGRDEDPGDDDYSTLRASIRPMDRTQYSLAVAFGIVVVVIVVGAAFDLVQSGILWVPLLILAGVFVIAALRSRT